MNILGIFKKVLPFLVSAIPGGGIASQVARAAIGSALKVEPPKDETETAELLAKATPEQMLALKQEEDGFKARMQELGFKEATDLERIAADDRMNARAREVAVKDYTPTLLAVTVTLGFFGLLGLICFHEPPSGMKDILLAMIGALSTAWISVVSYYFGSSSGSTEKTHLLADAAKAQTPQP